MAAGIEPRPKLSAKSQPSSFPARLVARLERHLAVLHGREDLQRERDLVPEDVSAQTPTSPSSSSSRMSSPFLALAVDEFGCQRWSRPFQDGGSPCSLSSAVVVHSRSDPMERWSPGIVSLAL